MKSKRLAGKSEWSVLLMVKVCHYHKDVPKVARKLNVRDAVLAGKGRASGGDTLVVLAKRSEPAFQYSAGGSTNRVNHCQMRKMVCV